MSLLKALSDGLKTQKFGWKTFVFDSIDSTNSCARLLAETGTEEGTVVFAEEQLKGRGRLNRNWISEKGANLLFSIVFVPNISQSRYYLIPLMVSVSIAETIKATVSGCTARLKWPNDILLQSGEKIGGILTELTRTYDNEPRMIVGIGLNVNQVVFPPELTGKASSIDLAVNKNRPQDPVTTDRINLFHEIIKKIEEKNKFLESDPDKVIGEWRSFCDMFGKPVEIMQGNVKISGTCIDIDDDGALIIGTEGKKTIRITAGDVSALAFHNLL